MQQCEICQVNWGFELIVLWLGST